MDSTEIVALLAGVAVLCALVWIWVPYLVRRPPAQHPRRAKDWNWPTRAPLPPMDPKPVQRFGKMPETWQDYKRERGLK
jgi:hypothetical protein